MATRKTSVQVSHEDIEWIKHKISEMDISITRIQQCVIGDAEYGQIGLVKQVEEHQHYIEKDKAYKSKVAGGMIVVGGLWTFVLKFWGQTFSVRFLYSALLKKNVPMATNLPNSDKNLVRFIYRNPQAMAQFLSRNGVLLPEKNN